MTLAELAGQLMHPFAPNGEAEGGTLADSYDHDAARRLILDRHITSLATRLAPPPARLAEQNNALQAIAERGRLGIPITLNSDPRNHFQALLGASVVAQGVTRWPDALGLAAIDDPALVQAFADRVRREYRAVGIAQAMHPQLDLATEPRWTRLAATFGEDPERACRLAAAYVAGLQAGPMLTRESILPITKHFAGYGAAPEGFDAHNHYGRVTDLDGAWAAHVRPFECAIRAGVAGMMPSYGILAGAPAGSEPVAGAFNRWLLRRELRGRLRFRGTILTDFSATRDCNDNCRLGLRPPTRADIGMPWGVEALSVGQRLARAFEAGVDQIGGVDQTDALIEAVRKGWVRRSRLEESARRLLAQKFALGLFEAPFVDPAAAMLDDPAAQALATSAQQRAMVPLKLEGGPPQTGTRVYLIGIEAEAARSAGLVPVGDPANAEIAMARLATPYERLHPNHFFGRGHHEGRLDFRPGDVAFDALMALPRNLPVSLSVYVDRGVILTNLVGRTRQLFADFGATDPVVIDTMLHPQRARGSLPIELPRSMAAVATQSPGKPADSRDPLFPLGFRATMDPWR